MKVLASVTTELVARPDRSSLPLCKITAYTDRVAGTVDKAYYLSNGARRFDFDNVGSAQQFLAYLMRAEGSFAAAMDHLTDPRAAGPDRQVTLVLANGRWPDPAGSAFLAGEFAAHKLLFAAVELAQLDRAPHEDHFDLRAVAANRKVTWFRGYIEKIGPTGIDEIPLSIVPMRPEIPWAFLNDVAQNDPRDLGTRIPMPYGMRRRGRCPGVVVGWKTTLAQEITAATTGNVKVGDASGFPTSGSFPVRIAGEDLMASWVDDHTINVSARGATPSAHKNGTTVVEVIASAKWCVGIGVTAVDALWIVNPFSGELVRVQNTGLYTVNTADVVSGVTATTVSFTAANLRLLLNTLEQQALVATQPTVTAQPTVTQQPVVSHPVMSDVFTQRPSNGDADLRDGNFGTGTVLGPGTPDSGSMGFADLGAIIEQTIFVNVAGVNSDLEVRSGSGVLIGTITSSSSGTYSFVTTNAENVWHVINIGGVNRAVNEIWRNLLFVADPPSVTTPVAIGGAAVGGAVITAAELGYGLEFFADSRGPVAAGGLYSVANGTLLENPSDILRNVHLRCGRPNSEIDATSFAAAVTNLGAFKMALDLTELGDHFDQVVKWIARDAGANYIQEEGATGPLWKLLTPEYDAGTKTFRWAGAITDLSEVALMKEESRDGSTVYTRFRALYGRDPSLGDVEEASAYLKVYRTDKDQNDLAAVIATAKFTQAEADYGRRDHVGFTFRCIDDDYSAGRSTAYYAQELMRDAKTYLLPNQPWTQAYPLERGDLVRATPLWEPGAPRKLRVLEYQKEWLSDAITLRATEVLTP